MSNARTDHSKEEEIQLQYENKRIKPIVKDVGGHLLANNYMLDPDSPSKQQRL